MALIEENKLITIDGASKLYNNLRDRIKTTDSNLNTAVESLDSKADKSALEALNTTVTNNQSAVDSALAAKADLVDGKVKSEQLPSYIDDVVEYASLSTFPTTGEKGKVYVALDTNIFYRWSGSTYISLVDIDLTDYALKSEYVSNEAFNSYKTSLAKGSATQPIYFDSTGTPQLTKKLEQDITVDSKLTDTTYSAGNGINLTGTQFSVDTAVIATVSSVESVNAKFADYAEKEHEHSTSDISTTDNAMFVTSTEKATWNAKTTMAEVEAKGYAVASEVNASIKAHTDATNPHGITPDSIGAAKATHNHAITDVTGLSDRLTSIEGAATTLTGTVTTLSSNFDTHFANEENPHKVTKAQVGLGNVDNTSDANKPISTATQNALNLKANQSDLTALNTTFTEHVSANEAAFNAIEDALNGYVLKVGEGIATMDDINEIIANANIAYTETALNIALDELNGEVV